MIQASATVHTGMDVYSKDGEMLGCVSAVWPHVPVAPTGEPMCPEEPPHQAVDEGWFQVDRGGALGIGAKHWYIPVREAGTVEPGGVTLACNADECEERYTNRPTFVDLDIT